MATSVYPLSSTALAEPEAAMDPILPLREASRKLVREWGFLRSTLTPYPLSPAAVHCLIEIGDYGRRTFPELRAELNVTPAELSHTLTELASSGTIKRSSHPTGQNKEDATEPVEVYSLTPDGVKTLGEINTYAQDQVTHALAAAPPGAGVNITAAFQAYATALERSRPSETLPAPDTAPAALAPPPVAPAVSIVPGYRPGILARTLEMHMDYYYEQLGWGLVFETGLGTSLADSLSRLDKPGNQVWAAVLTAPAQNPQAPAVERVVGVVYIDGDIMGKEGVARLRAFIVDESARGLGVGNRLMSAAMEFVREFGFRECHLTTMRGLIAARRLYERYGFKEGEEKWSDRHGKGVQELAYVWRRPDEV